MAALSSRKKTLFSLLLCATNHPALSFIPKSNRGVPSRIQRTPDNEHSSLFSSGNDDSLFDAEEAAAMDAHDVSDAGMEAAAMERAVIMAEEFQRQQKEKKNKPEKKSLVGKIKSAFEAPFHEDDEEEILDAEDMAAFDAHDASDSGMEAAAMERAVMMAEEMKEAHLRKRDNDGGGEGASEKINSGFEAPFHKDGEEEVLDAEDMAAFDAHDVSDSGMEAAAMERAVMMAEEMKEAHLHKQGKGGEKNSAKDHYDSIEKDVSDIENLIQRAAEADKAEHHTLERIFSDDDAADLALLMMEKSVEAAADKVQMFQEESEQTEKEVREALEEKYAAKALAESIERERHAVEMRFLTEHFDDEYDVAKRNRYASTIQGDNALLADALEQEHDAELRLEKAVEKDIQTKKELEHMIDNKAALKDELHELEKIIHERAMFIMEKEKVRQSKGHTK